MGLCNRFEHAWNPVPSSFAVAIFRKIACAIPQTKVARPPQKTVYDQSLGPSLDAWGQANLGECASVGEASQESAHAIRQAKTPDPLQAIDYGRSLGPNLGSSEPVNLGELANGEEVSQESFCASRSGKALQTLLAAACGDSLNLDKLDLGGEA